MEIDPDKFFRPATDFDVLLACPACKVAIQKSKPPSDVVRWNCDRCRLLYVPFFTELWVVELPGHRVAS